MTHRTVHGMVLLLLMTWIVSAHAEQKLDCTAKSAPKDDEVLIGWVTDVRVTTQFGHDIETTTTRLGPFRAVARIKDSEVLEPTGFNLSEGMRFWPALREGSRPVALRSVKSFVDYMNEPHCEYFADLNRPGYKRWTLFSNRPLFGYFRLPTSKERAEFLWQNKTCVYQGDYPANKTPPCSRPKILAVSERPTLRYWVTEPYKWDTGLTVWDKRGDKLVPLHKVCVGCSD